MKALITGCTGQDGYYLSEYLDSLGYKVYGGYRRSSSGEVPKWAEPVPLEMGEYESIKRAVDSIQPDEIYNLAAQSHVGESFHCPLYTFDINSRGLLRVLESVRGKSTRVYQASTSEMFGGGRGLSEESAFNPKSPYAIAKVAAHHTAKMYRVAYGTRVSCGILFNHESPRRGKNFVTRKACIAAANNRPLRLGNTAAKRDWGHAKDFVKAMHLMLQHTPDDFVIATGESFTVKHLVNKAFEIAGNEPNIIHSELEERPWDVEELEGDPSKAIRVLKWKREYDFDSLIKEMVESEQPAIRTAA